MLPLAILDQELRMNMDRAWRCPDSSIVNGKRLDTHFGKKIVYLCFISRGWNQETISFAVYNPITDFFFVKFKVICDCLHFFFLFFFFWYGDYPFISQMLCYHFQYSDNSERVQWSSITNFTAAWCNTHILLMSQSMSGLVVLAKV